MIVGGAAPAACAGGGASSTASAAALTPASGSIAARSSGPAGLRIEPGVQRERDQERRRILEDELQREQSVLNNLLKSGSGADAATVSRTQSNLSALRQELARATP